MGKASAKFIVSPEVHKALSIALGGAPSMSADWDFTSLPTKTIASTSDPKLDIE